MQKVGSWFKLGEVWSWGKSHSQYYTGPHSLSVVSVGGCSCLWCLPLAEPWGQAVEVLSLRPQGAPQDNAWTPSPQVPSIQAGLLDLIRPQLPGSLDATAERAGPYR